MTNTIKFSQFNEAPLNDGTTETVGLASGQNIKTPKVVTWTTATRPTPPVAWVIGANTSLGQYEFWDPNSSSWIQLTSSVDLTSTYILKTPDATLVNSFALSTLSTGILKSQTLTGNLSISVALTSIDSLTTVANEVLYTTAANTYAVTSLTSFSRGLLALANAPAWASALNVPNIPVTVNQGGTGDTSFVPFSVICGGTSSTGPLQSVLTVGTSGQILTSNGVGALPTWTNSASIGIVNPGLANELGYYATSGSTISGLATANNGVLVTDNSGVPSISSTLPNAVQLNITALGTIGTGVWNGSIIDLAHGGTNANLTASAGSIVYSTASAFALSAAGTTGQLLQSNGAGAPTWTTASFPGTVGSVGTILRSNGTDWVASTSAFADTYTASNILYSNGANNVVGLATANNGVLITSGAGVPSISSTLPSAVQGNITAVGTIASGVWNGTAVDVAHGGTGDTSFIAYSVICAGTSSTGNFQNVSGLGSIGQVLTSAGPGALPAWTNASGTGTVNSGLINQLAYYAAAGTAVSGLATANDGLLVTSNSGVPSILAGPGTTGNILQSNSAAAPSFSIATYPSTATSTGSVLRADGTNWSATTAAYPNTTTINQVLYSSANNTVSGLASAANGTLVTNASSVPSILAGPGTTGNILQSNAAAAPSFSTASYPSTSGTTGTILRSNGTNFVNSTSTFADTYASNSLLYASSANTVTALATAASAVLTTVASVPTWASELSLALGGTNAALTASNGGIVYSTASALAILSGTATAGLALLSGANTAPTWSSSPPITRINIQRITATGAGTYTPTSGMVYVLVQAQAAGGGGGGGASTIAAQVSLGGAGGGGEYIEALFTAANIGASKAYSVGAKGTGGSAGNNAGTAGGNTTFNTTWIITVGGGAGPGSAALSAVAQLATSGGSSGTGGSVATGTLLNQIAGEPAEYGLVINSSQGIGGSGGKSGAGYPGSLQTTTSTSSTAGTNAGTNSGAGGSGGASSISNAAAAGGNGGDGFINFIEFISV